MVDFFTCVGLILAVFSFLLALVALFFSSFLRASALFYGGVV